MPPGDDSGAKLVSEWISYCSGVGFGSIFAPFWRLFWSQKSIIWGIDFVIIFVKRFLLLLERFGVDVGAILVSKE